MLETLDNVANIHINSMADSLQHLHFQCIILILGFYSILATRLTPLLRNAYKPFSAATCEVFTAVTMKKFVFWEVIPCDSFKNQRFGGTYLHHQGASVASYR
jgi:hypothetical protein